MLWTPLAARLPVSNDGRMAAFDVLHGRYNLSRPCLLTLLEAEHRWTVCGHLGTFAVQNAADDGTSLQK